ncbi:MAG: histidine ammonia-lyase [Alphaproteobacteria bacterium]|nr:histidine ammonia-lyase [Alphaproteobacteria bacterium]
MTLPPLDIDGNGLRLEALVQVARQGRRVHLSPWARREMVRSRAWVDAAVRGELIDASGQPRVIYGVNTGYGSLSRVRIPQDRLNALSRNLLRSHAAGVGAPVAPDAARATVLLRANALSKGFSGCRPELVELLLALLNRGVVPVLPAQGSCGSSGDLAPLSHLGLLIGHAPDDPDHETGEAWVGGQRMCGRAAMAAVGLQPLVLGPKEGLAINNGAQLTTAITALTAHDAAQLTLVAEIAAAMSIEALHGVTRAFHPLVHAMRPYGGAIACAANLLSLLHGSTLVDSVPGKVQDAYSLRCTPQVLGAVRDAVGFVVRQVSVELNAVTDNPLILPDAPGDDKAFSAGMFHGEPVGMAADFLKIATAELASLSERRLYRLLTGALSDRLPPSLDDGPGIGLLALQTTAAALVSENKALSWPASVDSIPTCEDQEDHVAMSTTAARRAADVLENTRYVVGIELLCATRALAWRQADDPGLTLGRGTGAAFHLLDEALRALPHEATPAEQLAAIEPLVQGPALASAVRAVCPRLREVSL